ncbi:MAG: DUF6638 family protein [Maritimibacter sp.]
MKRLIEKGLMFGNMVRVDSPALVERYNRALEKLTGLRTKLDDFYIDISGFSPEIGDELGDMLYLNPNGVNRMFIILDTDQKSAPLLDAKFSTSRGILRRFIEDNEAKLFALTAHDAVAGELDNSVFEAASPARLLDIRKINVMADTTQGHVAGAQKLAAKIEVFQSQEDAWFDDVLIAEMIELAKTTGDVTRQPIDLAKSTYIQQSFWTSHFGGLYVFRDDDKAAVISVMDKSTLGNLAVDAVLDLSDRNAIAAFLDANDMVEPVIKARGVDGASIIRQKMDFILVEAATRAGLAVKDIDHRTLHRLAQKMGNDLPEEFLKLNELVRWALHGAKWPRISSSDPAYFYTLRARPDHPERDLINQLLSELSPLDIRQLFICHKQAFYAAYSTWSEAKRDYVIAFLEADYLSSKAEARDALFGGREPKSPRSKPVSPAAKPDIVDIISPWGALRKTQ